MKTKLNLLLRKNKGIKLLPSYKRLFLNVGFDEKKLQHIPIDEFDQKIGQLRLLNCLSTENEYLSRIDYSTTKSAVLTKLLALQNESSCYVFTDSSEFCGAFLTELKEAGKYVLNVALNDSQGTCFILDSMYSYYVKINFYGDDHYDDPNTFDISVIYF